MKYKIVDGYIYAYYPDGTGLGIPYLGEDSIKDVYILSKNPNNRGDMKEMEDMIEWEKPSSIPSSMEVDWYSLTAKVYDQYGEIFPTDVSFTIEGEGAEIQENKVVEKEVEEPTSYFIVAKAGDLEERQERHVYPKPTHQPSEIDIANAKIEALSIQQEMTSDLLQEMILKLYE